MISTGLVLSTHPRDGTATRPSVLLAETITEPPTIHSRVPQPAATLPHNEPALHRDSVPQPVCAAEPVTCCPPHCQGQVCSNSHSLMRKLVTDLDELVNGLEDLTRIEQQVSYKVSFRYALTLAAQVASAFAQESALLIRSDSRPCLATPRSKRHCNGPSIACMRVKSDYRST